MENSHFQNQPQSNDTYTSTAVVDNRHNILKSSTPTQTQQNYGAEASSSEPCPFCGRPRYCFTVKDLSDEPYKVICHWTDPTNPPSGWRHVGSASDGRPIFLKDGHRATKRRKNKKFPALIELKPQHKDIPQWSQVEIPIEKLEKGHSVRLKPGCPGGDKTIYIVEKIDSGKNLGLGKQVGLGATIKRADSGINAFPIALDDIAEVITHDAVTGAKEQFIEYYYSDTQKVVRKQWTDRRPAYKYGKTKDVRPYYQAPDGQWVCGKGDKPWPLYRNLEVESALQRDGILFAAAGEQAVEALRSIGLTATCNQGGEGGFGLIASKLATAIEDAPQSDEENVAPLENKPPSLDDELASEREQDASELLNPKCPLLVIWGDNDDAGRIAAQNLLKSCYKNKVTAIVIDPKKLWVDMPQAGDAFDWIKYCRANGISDEQMCRMLECAIDSSIDAVELDNSWRASRQGWNPPISYQGEIGYWKSKTDKETGETIRWFEPACNFDFQIECELEDSFGGGLVLQVKRCFEDNQTRVILNSTDYTNPDTFTNALKRGLGVGVVCNLTKVQLSALIHARLHEYRTTRQGKKFKRIDRYGQQEDGTWVFRDRQFKKDGTSTSEYESGWVFNSNLGRDDYIPCPELAPASIDPKAALFELIEASRIFFTPKNFHQAVLMMGAAVAGLYYQDIRAANKCHPQINAYGEAGSQKTNAAEAALSLIGTSWHDDAMFARISASALYEHASRTGSLPFVWDDPPRDPKNEELGKLLFGGKPRKVRGNEQMPHSPMMVITNHAFGESQAATYTRYNRIHFFKINQRDIIDPLALQRLTASQLKASAAFPLLLSLGYHHEEILKLESELLPYLAEAHNRTPKGFAIIIWFAQALINLVGGGENIKQWVIDNVCPSENDSDNTGDSLADFIAKIQVLEAESMVGDWNFKRDVIKDGRKYYALYAADVWKLVDNRFSPATYNEKSLKSLVQKSGGIVNTTVRFTSDKDLALAYKRALISASPEFPPTPPGTEPRKAWLLPAELFGENPDDGGDDSDPSPPPPPPPSTVTNVTERNKSSVTPPKQDSASTSTPSTSTCNRVTESNENENNEKKSSLLLKVGDFVEFKDVDGDFWRRGRICDLQQEKGILIYATVEYFVKGQKRKEAKIHSVDWLRRVERSLA